MWFLLKLSGIHIDTIYGDIPEVQEYLNILRIIWVTRKFQEHEICSIFVRSLLATETVQLVACIP